MMFVMTTFGVYLAYQRPTDVTELTLGNEPSVELTSRPEVTGLTSQYSYLGQSITTLFNLRTTLTNTGNTTLVGSGGRTSLLDDVLRLNVSEGYSILRVETVGNDPESTVSVRSNQIEIQFGQWKEQEELILVSFISPDPTLVNNNSAADVFLSAPTRQIIDGEVAAARSIMDSAGDSTSSQRSRLADELGVLSIASRFVSGIFGMAILAGGIAGLLATLSIPYTAFKFNRWNSKYGASFAQFLESIDPEDPELVDFYDPVNEQDDDASDSNIGHLTIDDEILEWDEDYYLKFPTRLPDFLWSRFSHPMAPTDRPLGLGSIVAIVLALGTVFALGMAIVSNSIPAEVDFPVI